MEKLIILILLILLIGCNTYTGDIRPGMNEWDYKMYNEDWELACNEFGCVYSKPEGVGL